MKHKICLFLLSALIAVPFANVCGQKTVSQETMAEKVKKDRARGIVLPHHAGHYEITKHYIEEEPDADYLHASEAAYEAFRDIKFSVRIHWGVYSMLGVEASWPLLEMSNEKKQEYQNLYKQFNPTEFDAQEWMDFFKRSGIQAFAFTTKHHDGFSMFHTQTRVKQRANYLDTANIIEPCDLAYSIEETPFKRDIVKELCDAAHKNDIKINLYFSHPDWYDADFRPFGGHPLTTSSSDSTRIWTPNPTQEERTRMMKRHRGQLLELLTNYGKIDMICLDMMLGKEVWPETRETVKMMRKIQPDVMLRCRGIGNYGDYYTPENKVFDAGEVTNMPWMTIYKLGRFFAYDPDANRYKGTPWIIHNLIDCLAKGGNFQVGISPDPTGKFHPTAVKQLEETGKWLKVNGEGIYETRGCQDGKIDDIYFTRTKDHKKVFAFVEKWPGTEIVIPSVNPKKGSKIYLFGYKKPLKWSQTDKGVKIEIPEALQSPENRPCDYAWGFQIEVK
jgi:alpha-L-fucosidase